MPFKFNVTGRHRIPRARYRVRNWPAYEAGLKRRGDLRAAIPGTLISISTRARIEGDDPEEYRRSFCGRQHGLASHLWPVLGADRIALGSQKENI